METSSGIIYKRLIIDKISKYLRTNDIIVLLGARQVGKTSILHYIEKLLNDQNEITHFIDLEDSRFKEILDKGVEEFVKYLKEEGLLVEKSKNKKIFVFVDEIQYLENPSSFLKLIADHYKQIKLIVSGSSSFNIKNKFKNSLVGRTVNFEIFNLCFEEFLLFKKYHFDRDHIHTEKKINELVSLYKDYVLYGGYPKIVLTEDTEIKEKYIQQIIDTYIRKDIRDLAEIKELNKFNQLLEILASQCGQLLNVAEISNTINLSKLTVERYLFFLEQTYIIKLVRPYKTNLRAELTKTPKIYFYDTGLAHLLWLKELPKQILGQIFETSIFSELIKKYGSDKIFYWRTMDKKEIDFILRKNSGILPVEAKLNFAQTNLTAINYFFKDKKSDFKIVALNGEKKMNKQIYPWEL